MNADIVNLSDVVRRSLLDEGGDRIGRIEDVGFEAGVGDFGGRHGVPHGPEHGHGPRVRRKPRYAPRQRQGGVSILLR